MGTFELLVRHGAALRSVLALLSVPSPANEAFADSADG